MTARTCTRRNGTRRTWGGRFLTRAGVALVALVVASMGSLGLSGSIATALTSTGGPPENPTHSAPETGTGWSKPRIAHKASALDQRMSCTSTTFCMAIDTFGWYETFDGTTWSTPARVVPDSALRELFPLGSYVSCLSSTFCLAVETNDEYTPHEVPPQSEIWDGTSWSAPTPLPLAHVLAITCASETLCFAADDTGDVSTFTGSGWSDPVLVDRAGPLYGLSCASTTFCMSVGEGTLGSRSWAYEFDGSTWSATAHSDSKVHFYAVSCPSATYCMAVNQGNDATFDGTKWTRPHRMPISFATRSLVSCPQPGTCMATDQSYWEENIGGVWTTGHMYRQSKKVWPESIDCLSATACVGFVTPTIDMVLSGVHSVPGYSYASLFDGTAWSDNPTLVNAARFQPNSASCPRANACVVVDNTGWAFTRTNGTLNPPFQVDDMGSQVLTGVTCVSTAFCLARDNEGRVATFDFAGHVSITMVAPGYGGLKSLSCGAPTLCMAVTPDNLLIQYDGTGWSDPFTPQAGFTPTDVNCVTASFCMAVGQMADNQAEATSYDGSTWSDLTALVSSDEPYFISCGSTTLCGVMVGRYTEVYSTLGCNGAGPCWDAGVQLHPDSIPIGLSCGETTCILGTDGPDYGDRQAHVNVWQQGAWSKDHMLSDKGGVEATACSANDTCVLLVRDFEYVYHGSR